MLGYGAIGQFTVGQVAAASAEFISEDKWGYPWSEPLIKIKIGLSAGNQQFLTFQPSPSPFVATGWYDWLSEPVRFNRLITANNPYLFQDAGFLIGTDKALGAWYDWYAEPVRLKIGLSATLQQTLAYHPRVLPKPNITATLRAFEFNSDAATMAIYVIQSQPAVSAKVSIVETGGGTSATSIWER